MEKPPLILIALYYLKSKEGEIPLSYPTLTSQRHISIPKALLSKQLVKQPSESSKRTKGNFRESFDFRAKKDTQDKNLECLETLI